MEYILLLGRSGVSGAWNDISINPVPIVLGVIGVLAFFWLISKA